MRNRYDLAQYADQFNYGAQDNHRAKKAPTELGDEVTYFRKKLGAKSVALIAALAGFSLYMVWSGIARLTHCGADQPLEQMWALRSLVGGALCTLVFAVASFQLLKGARQQTPRLTLNDAGISYEMTNQTVYEARWTSLGPFELNEGTPLDIRATVTGKRTTENLEQGDEFIILLSMLDAGPNTLVAELNRRRKRAILRREWGIN